MLQVEAVYVTLAKPPPGQVGQVRATTLQASGNPRLTWQALDLDEHQRAAHGGFGTVTPFTWMIVRLRVHASAGAHPYISILHVLFTLVGVHQVRSSAHVNFWPWRRGRPALILSPGGGSA
jgi:hypothetical protein